MSRVTKDHKGAVFLLVPGAHGSPTELAPFSYPHQWIGLSKLGGYCSRGAKFGKGVDGVFPEGIGCANRQTRRSHAVALACKSVGWPQQQ